MAESPLTTGRNVVGKVRLAGEEMSSTDEFVIVAQGASAGGLEALEKFFQAMPADAAASFIVVQHLAPDHATALPELLARRTGMPAAQARDATIPVSFPAGFMLFRRMRH